MSIAFLSIFHNTKRIANTRIDKIDNSRYESYREFIKEAKEYKEKIKYEGKKEENSKKTVHNKTVAKISERKRQSARNTLKQQLYKDIDYENADE